MFVIGIATAAAASLVAAPFVSMSRRGTLDQRCLQIIRAEAAHLAAQRMEQGRSVGTPFQPVVIPAPRLVADAVTRTAAAV